MAKVLKPIQIAGAMTKPPGRHQATRLLTPGTVGPALKQALIMLRPDIQWKNPVMFVVEVGAFLTLAYLIQALLGKSESQVSTGYFVALDIWLFLTVLFANFATALAEARGRAQADSLKKTRRDTIARRLTSGDKIEEVTSTVLKIGDRVVIETGEIVPGDGEIIEGIASIDESAITGESAPVIREAGGDRSGVTGGTLVVSDRIIVRITSGAGESFLDRMIGLVEGAIRQRTPNEIALTLVLSAFTLIFLIVVIPLWPMALNAEQYMTSYLGLQEPLHSLGTDIPTLIALLVCLIPTTIGALLAAIGIAGMDRALQANILAKSGKAVETAGDIDVVLLDKTGTITMGNRHATEFLPIGRYSASDVARLASLASAADETPEGKSIKTKAKELVTIGQLPLHVPDGAEFVPFTAQTRMSGINLPNGRKIRKGASDAIVKLIKDQNAGVPAELDPLVESVASKGATPLVVAEDAQIVGIVVLEDVLKPAMSERFERLRRMGLRTVMITGDNPLTAATIAKKAGVDDFLAQAKPEDKLAYIRREQAEGKLVAMMGDGTNDAPALAQADVALAMNAGTQAAKEAANMVDLDSDPTKLIEVVEIGKQLLMTRGALTTFSVANDVAKYFAIIPALFAGTLPWLKRIDIMQLHSPTSAILSAVIFNALIIPLLIPVALKGVSYRPLGADALLRKNLLIWGLGGVIIPFIGIKIIDLIMVAFHLVA
ncbi:MAG TPA: potassium-transporting ATPase subunit KdpB [Chthoniobacterales bacterium]|jgi:potassium-transporting ATPase ATP-binding subunit|nr:potassium-transporting ATPase subunit KdpB [Chthoniobacterales bacterium]